VGKVRRGDAGAEAVRGARKSRNSNYWNEAGRGRARGEGGEKKTDKGGQVEVMVGFRNRAEKVASFSRRSGEPGFVRDYIN